MGIFSIGAPNYLEPNLAALTLGSFTTTGPRDNLADPDLGNPAITTDATTTSTQVAIDLTAITTLRGEIAGADALFIPRTNLTQNAIQYETLAAVERERMGMIQTAMGGN